jgi:hypothetical protein
MSEKRERDKSTHEEAKYEHPSRHRDQHCSICEHFIKTMPPRCEVVKSPIRAVDWCKWWERRDYGHSH